MSVEGMQVTVVANGLIEALKKDGVNLDDRLGKNASNYVREIVAHLSQPQPVAQGYVSDDEDGDPVWSFAVGRSIYSIVKHDEGHQLVHTEAGTLKLLSKPFSLVAQDVSVRRYRFDPYGMREDADGAYVLYATPTTPTGHRVAPVEPDILRDLRKFQEETEACDEFDLTNESIAALLIANLIEGTHYMLTKKGEAMLAAAPDAGGV